MQPPMQAPTPTPTPACRFAVSIARRNRKYQHLVNRTPVNAKIPCGLTAADTFNQHRVPYTPVKFHLLHLRPLQSRELTIGGVLLRRQPENPIVSVVDYCTGVLNSTTEQLWLHRLVALLHFGSNCSHIRGNRFFCRKRTANPGCPILFTHFRVLPLLHLLHLLHIWVLRVNLQQMQQLQQGVHPNFEKTLRCRTA
jgi:hypothetical protein